MTEQPNFRVTMEAAIAEYREAERIEDQTLQREKRMAALQRFRQAAEDATSPTQSLDEAINAYEAAPDNEKAVGDLIREIKAIPTPPASLPEAKTISAMPHSKLPKAILGATGHGGAILPEGEVCILAGEGGIAKSGLTLRIARDFASPQLAPFEKENQQPEGLDAPERGLLCNDLFRTETGGGPVLMLTYEDTPEVMAWKLREGKKYAKEGDTTLSRIHVMDMASWPLYGPGERQGGAGLYNATPEKLRGWEAMEAAFERIKPRLVVIDPALSAFTGDSNAAGPVRAFLSDLVRFARDQNQKPGFLVVAHATKAARGGRDNNKEDPFEPGLVGGSGHWTDGVRCAMTLTWKPKNWEGKIGKDRILAVVKANWGPQRIWCDLNPETATGGTIIGLYRHPGSSWQKQPEETEKESGADTRAKTGSGKPRPKTKAERIAARDAGKDIL
ncbi:MAG: AAA family ATPase [Boseongicola sp.]|nr:AAA family ATPase [Boseongicola sp.]